MIELDEKAVLVAFKANHHPDAEPSSVELAKMRRSIRAYLVAATPPLQLSRPSSGSTDAWSSSSALEWYAWKVADCRKIGPDGDYARSDLDADGGRRARAASTSQRLAGR